MKKLPGIYHKDITKNISNNQESFYVSKEKIQNNINKSINVEDFIDGLFKENGYVFNKPLLITTRERVYDTAIVKKDKTKIFTLTDDVIDLDSIISIERK